MALPSICPCRLVDIIPSPSHSCRKYEISCQIWAKCFHIIRWKQNLIISLVKVVQCFTCAKCFYFFLLDSLLQFYWILIAFLTIGSFINGSDELFHTQFVKQTLRVEGSEWRTVVIKDVIIKDYYQGQTTNFTSTISEL